MTYDPKKPLWVGCSQARASVLQVVQHETHDPWYVKQFLGHKSIRNTEIYINIERTLFDSDSDKFTMKVTDKPDEVKSLLEVGFEYVCQKDNLIFLRKRK